MGKKKRQSMKEKAQENARNSNKGSSFLNLPEGTEKFKPKAGKSYILDLLPYEITAKGHLDNIDIEDIWYKKPYKLHVNIGSENKAYVCPATMGKKCPICERRTELLRDPDIDYQDKEVKALRPKDRVLYNVRTVNKKKFSDIMVWDFSFYNFQELFDEEINDSDNDEYGGFGDLEGGNSIKIKFKEANFEGNKFPKARKIDFEDRKDIDESILEDVVNLDEILEVKGYKELERILLDIDDDDDSNDSDDDDSNDSDDDDSNDSDDDDSDDDSDDDDSNDSDDDDSDDNSDDDDSDEPNLDDMDKKELLKYIKENKIKIDKDKLKKAKKDEKKLRKLIIKTLEDSKDSDSDDSDDSKCPHGHTFGTDCDDFPDDCDECISWDKCYDEKED